MIPQNNRIFAYALISSPLLALYAAAPFYIFGILNLSQSLQIYTSAIVSAAIYWIINSLLFIRFEKKQTWQTIILSYLLTFFSNVLKAPFQSFVEFRSMVEEFVVYPIIITVAVNTIILLMINAIIGERKRQEANLTIAKLQVQKLQAENGMLMQQLQPHFLFNALSVLKSLITEDPKIAEKYSVKLSDFLRYTVDSHSSDYVTLKEEMQFAYNYLDLQKIRFENAFEFEIDLPEELHDTQIPVFAIQVLLENAFKHNYFTEKRPLRLSIKKEEEGIVVSNNIVSLKVTERAGTGLANLEKRYQFLTGKGIAIQQTDSSFQVTLPIVNE